ncbi:MAG TPA: hypothetical protein VH142_24345, partial [Polyangiaceae bacterium]|nr:hypothetical protein [Polyangiaceae bacterium]
MSMFTRSTLFGLMGIAGLVGSLGTACSSDSGGQGQEGPETGAPNATGGGGAGNASGATSSGGNTGSGGATSSGGETGSGGATSSGGKTGSGGTLATGGASGSGGSGAVSDAGPDGNGGPDASSGGGADGSVPDSGADSGAPGPAITGVGAPIAGVPVASASIGAAGGTLTSGDGQVVLTIPAGALATTTTIGIQAIDNLAPGGTGYAYRFTPDGQQFTKAVTLAFTPTYGQLDGSSVDHVGLGFQDTAHEWEVVPVTANTTTKTVTATTTHFTDYAYLLTLFIDGSNVLFTKQSALFSVMAVDPTLDAWGKPQSLAQTGNPTWLLDGTTLGNGSDGTLAPFAEDATYTAPATIPSTDPVSVSASFKASGGQQVTLATNVYILAHQYHLDVTIIDDMTCVSGGSGYSFDYSTEGGIDLTLDASFNVTSSNPTPATTPTISAATVCVGVCTATPEPAKTPGLALSTVTGHWQRLLRRLALKPSGTASGDPDLEVDCGAAGSHELTASADPWNAPGYLGYLKGKDG